MKSYYLLIITLFIAGYCNAVPTMKITGPSIQTENYTLKFRGSDSLRYNYYLAKNINNRLYTDTFSITIKNLPSSFNRNDSVLVQFERIVEYGSSIVYTKKVLVGDSIVLAKLTTNILGSSIYRVRVVKNAYTSYFFSNQFLVSEKYKTITIQGNLFMFMYVEDFFKRSTILEDSLIKKTQRALDFSWQYQINRWKIGSLTKPVFDRFYFIYFTCTNDLSETLFRYRGIDEVCSNPEDNIRAIWIPVNAKRNMGATTTLDDSTFFKMVIGHEFFHGLQFSVMKYSALLAANPTKERAAAELEHRKWLLEGQARFFETVMMDSSIRNGKNAAYVMNSMEQDYSSDCRDFLTDVLGAEYNKNGYADPYTANYKYCLFFRYTYENNDAILGYRTLEYFFRSWLFSPENAYNIPLWSTTSRSGIYNVLHGGPSLESKLENFAEAVYFHKKRWINTPLSILGSSRNLVKLGWNSPNGKDTSKTNFYDTLGSTILPSRALCFEASEFNGTKTETTAMNSLMFRPHVITAACNAQAQLKISFDSTGGTYRKNLYLIRNGALIQKKVFKNTTICWTKNDTLVLIVSRTDVLETKFNYSITVELSSVGNTAPKILFNKTQSNTSNEFKPSCNVDLSKATNIKWKVASDSSTAEKPTFNISCGGIHSVKLSYHFCKDTVLLRTNVIKRIPVYIKSCNISNTLLYNRTINASGQLSMTKTGTTLFDKKQTISISVQLSDKFKQLTINVIQPDKSILYSDTKTPDANNMVTFTCTPVSEGVHTLAFNGTDLCTSLLFNRTTFTKPLIAIDTSSNISRDTSYTNCVGTDANYSFTVAPNNSTGGKTLDGSLIIVSCTKANVTFYNYDTVDYYILFGDGDTIATLIPARSTIKHLYASNTTAIVRSLSGNILQKLNIILK